MIIPEPSPYLPEPSFGKTYRNGICQGKSSDKESLLVEVDGKTLKAPVPQNRNYATGAVVVVWVGDKEPKIVGGFPVKGGGLGF